MKKRMVLIVIVILLLALPAAVHAQRFARIKVGIEDLAYTDLAAADTRVEIRENNLLVTTKRLSGTGTLNCNGDTVCEDAGLDGAALRIGQEMQIVIDIIDAGVVGRARGALSLGESGGNLRWRGRVQGTAACLDSPCRTLDVDVTVGGRVFDTRPDRGVTGRLTLSLSGQFMFNPTEVTAHWDVLGGFGTAILREDPIIH